MQKGVIIWTIITLFSWGIGSFFSKIAAGKIGVKGAIFEFITYFLGVLIIVFFFFL